MFYPTRKLVYYLYDDFVIRFYIYKTSRVNSINHPCEFTDKIFLACNSSCHIDI